MSNCGNRVKSAGRWAIFAAWLLMAAVAWPTSSARAHNWVFAGASAEFSANGAYKVRLRFDVPAYLLNDLPERVADADMMAMIEAPPDELDAQLEKVRRRFQNSFRVRADGKEFEGTVVDFPTRRQIEEWVSSGREPRLPIMLSLLVEGLVPVTTTELALKFPEAIGDVLVSFELPGGVPQFRKAPAGRFCENVAVSFSPREPEVEVGGGFPGVFAMYLALGFQHILPKGLDHILFVLGIFFLGSRIGGLLWQVTAFTVAHSVTLALSLYGVVRLPPEIVEPIISASIAFICIENLFATRVSPWRVAVVFGFGLIHGLGFAGVLEELGLPGNQFVEALVAFNIGVEFGQIAVLALAFLAVGWWRNKPWYSRCVARPASALIACVAVYWTVERIEWKPGAELASASFERAHLSDAVAIGHAREIVGDGAVQALALDATRRLAAE